MCNWALDRSYKVWCKAQGEVSVWVQDWCNIGFYCKQLQNVKSWRNTLSYDVKCVPSNSIVKWAIGARQTGLNYKEYCSSLATYNIDRTRTKTYRMIMNFWGKMGLKTQILYGKILLNGQTLMENFNANEVDVTYALAPKDTIQYCGEAGSAALIEGYGEASFVKWGGPGN